MGGKSEPGWLSLNSLFIIIRQIGLRYFSITDFLHRMHLRYYRIRWLGRLASLRSEPSPNRLEGSYIPDYHLWPFPVLQIFDIPSIWRDGYAVLEIFSIVHDDNIESWNYKILRSRIRKFLMLHFRLFDIITMISAVSSKSPLLRIFHTFNIYISLARARNESTSLDKRSSVKLKSMIRILCKKSYPRD